MTMAFHISNHRMVTRVTNMNGVQHLRAFVAKAGRAIAAGLLGLAICAAVAGLPVRAFAQTANAASAAPSVATTVLPAMGEGPAMWVIRDVDSTLYLFGTVHILRPNTGWGTAKVDAAFDSADELWIEFADVSDPTGIQTLFDQYGLSPDRPLSTLLTAEERADLDAAARTLGGDAAAFETNRPWRAGVILGLAAVVKAGFSPASGIEPILKARAVAAEKPIKAFETADQQVRMLAALTEETQLEFLRSTLEDFETATTDLDKLANGWAAGDVEMIDELAVEAIKAESDEVYEAVIVNRNTDWANQIETMLNGSGTTFIAVGAAHLVGDDSVQQILEQRGILATRE